MVTIKMIAEQAGVSRGTVDRILHERPGVKPEVRQQVLQVMAELNYQPARYKPILEKKRLGVIFGMPTNAVHQQILEGIEAAGKQFSDLVDLRIRWTEKFTSEGQAKLIQDMVEEGLDGLAVYPLDGPETRGMMEELARKNVPVVTFNSDFLGSQKLCFVGQNHELAGKVAGELMNCACGGKGTVIINFGLSNVYAIVQRSTMFTSVIKDRFPGIKIAQIISSYEDEDVAYRMLRQALIDNPEVNGIYSVTATAGAARAILEMPPERSIRHICHDMVPGLLKVLEKNPGRRCVDFMIGQAPFRQGYYSVKILLDYLVKKIVPDKVLRMPIDIRVPDTAHMDTDKVFILNDHQ